MRQSANAQETLAQIRTVIKEHAEKARKNKSLDYKLDKPMPSEVAKLIICVEKLCNASSAMANKYNPESRAAKTVTRLIFEAEHAVLEARKQYSQVERNDNN